MSLIPQYEMRYHLFRISDNLFFIILGDNSVVEMTFCFMFGKGVKLFIYLLKLFNSLDLVDGFGFAVLTEDSGMGDSFL